MSKKYQILSFGEALIDFTPTDTGAYMPNPGGAPLNLAVCAAKYGCKAAFVGKLGKDAFGELIKTTVENAGLDVNGILWDGERVTTHAFVTLGKDGERDFVFCRDHGADVAVKAEDLPYDMLADTELFHFGGLSLTHVGLKEACLAAISHAKGNGALISFDPNYRAPLWESASVFTAECMALLDKVDILKVSSEEALMLTAADKEDDAMSALERKVSLVLLTKGAEGVLISLKGERLALPAFPANTVDTTGAGDVFFGTFLAAMLSEGLSVEALDGEAVKRLGEKACYYAAKSTEKYGAIPSIPNFCEEN